MQHGDKVRMQRISRRIGGSLTRGATLTHAKPIHDVDKQKCEISRTDRFYGANNCHDRTNFQTE